MKKQKCKMREKANCCLNQCCINEFCDGCSGLDCEINNKPEKYFKGRKIKNRNLDQIDGTYIG